MRKETTFWNYPLVIMGLSLLLLISCKKSDSTKDPTPTSTTVTDIDGNVYHTVPIGTQVWMVENLKTTKYRNGDPITTNLPNNSDWVNINAGAFCWYLNDIANKSTYGALYNWYAVTDSRYICPLGWHIPTNAEWTTLSTYLGGDNVSGGKLKETDKTHWLAPNLGATNETGFTGLPGGLRGSTGLFDDLGNRSYWWSSTVGYGGVLIWVCSLSTTNAIFSLNDNISKGQGLSVRCIKD